MGKFLRLIILLAAVLATLAGVWLIAVGMGWLAEQKTAHTIPFAGPVLLLMAAVLLLLYRAVFRNPDRKE